jgi:tetratricopeptide (TPR) repeat protein
LIATIESLGNLLRELGRLSEALPMLRRALEMSERVNSPNDVARCASSLAGLLQQMGDVGEAMELYQRQEAIISATVPPDSMALAACHNNIGNIYLANGMVVEAESRFERSIQLTEETVGEIHPEIIMGLCNLGRVRIREGRYRDANVLLYRAAAISGHYYGYINIHTARALEALGLLSYERGDANWRQKALLVLKLFESNLGIDHPETVRVRQRRRAMLMRWHLRRHVAGSLAVILVAGVIWFYFIK